MNRKGSIPCPSSISFGCSRNPPLFRVKKTLALPLFLEYHKPVAEVFHSGIFVEQENWRIGANPTTVGNPATRLGG
jgi:hypothetical protein